MENPARNDQPMGGREAATAAGPRHRSVVTGMLLFVAVALVLDGVVGERGWLANRRARLQFEQATQALDAMRRQNAAAREDARRLREDPAAIEELARREWGFIRKGEKVFILRDVQKPAK